jgi:hypothetical protein
MLLAKEQPQSDDCSGDRGGYRNAELLQGRVRHRSTFRRTNHQTDERQLPDFIPGQVDRPSDLAILDAFEKSLSYAETAVAEPAKRDKPQVKFSYLNSDIPINDRLDRLDAQCAPLVAKRSQSVVDFYAKLLVEARDTEQSIEVREAQMPKLWGYCIGVGLKM